MKIWTEYFHSHAQKTRPTHLKIARGKTPTNPYLQLAYEIANAATKYRPHNQNRVPTPARASILPNEHKINAPSDLPTDSFYHNIIRQNH
jgi:hypothetical protein